MLSQKNNMHQHAPKLPKKGDDDKTGDFDQILGDLPDMGLREGEASTHMRPFPETKQARDELKVGSDRLERPWVACCLFRSNTACFEKAGADFENE